jgi:hypothetical protein
VIKFVMKILMLGKEILTLRWFFYLFNCCHLDLVLMFFFEPLCLFIMYVFICCIVASVVQGWNHQHML